MFEVILAKLLPREPLKIPPKDLAVTLDYQKRISRGRIEVDSEASESRKMMLTTGADQQTGSYLGFGHQIIRLD